VQRAQVLVAAWPHVYATALAAGLRGCGAYEVEVADLDAPDWEPSGRYDAAVTSMPVPGAWASVIVELPASLDEPLRVTIGDVTVETHLGDPTIDGVIALLRRYITDSHSTQR
jgi:hypothetical protein